jgi:hypothetical protein
MLLGMYDGYSTLQAVHDAQQYLLVLEQPIQGIYLDPSQLWAAGMANNYYIGICTGAGQAVVSVPPLVGVRPAPVLSSTLSTGSPVTALQISALPSIVTAGGTFSSGIAIPTGTPIVLVQGAHTQTFTTSGTVSIGVTSIPVASQTPTYAFTSATTLYVMGCTISPNATNGTTATPTLMTLAAVAAGTWDTAFTSVFSTIAGVRPNTILRIGWESYGNVTFGWPWCGADIGPALKLAFQHLSTLAKSVSSSFKIDWNGALVNNGYDPMTSGDFPGTSYVDYIGCDVYENQGGGSSGAAGWAVVGASLVEGLAFAQANGKPFTIPEFGLWPTGSGGSGDDPAWLEAAYYWMRANAASLGYVLFYNEGTAFATYPQSAALFTSLYGEWAHILSGLTTHRFLSSGTNRLRVA